MTAVPDKRASVLRYLNAHYGITTTSFVHDEFIVEVPENITEEQANVIEAEVRVLFGRA
jgi:hypothetical protein